MPRSAPFVIGIAGGSASGKSTLAQATEERLGARCLRIAHDRYYRSAHDPETNFDHPEALDTLALAQDLDRLRSGQPAHLPRYDFSSHQRLPKPELHLPRPILIVEGILVLAVPELHTRLDLKIFVTAPADVRLIRRLRRDVAERGRSMGDVLSQYERSVRPMHERFVAPSEAHADLVLDGMGHPRDLAQSLIEAIPGLYSGSWI
ncbi:MAG TPA: uridine kinase [Deltaproteobacteria bacterium]|nr:uridine kinase [Deltaproteobacteria bacterium]